MFPNEAAQIFKKKLINTHLSASSLRESKDKWKALKIGALLCYRNNNN